MDKGRAGGELLCKMDARRGENDAAACSSDGAECWTDVGALGAGAEVGVGPELEAVLRLLNGVTIGGRDVW